MALLMAFMVINYGDRAVLALAARPVTSELGLSAQQYGLIRTAGNSPSAMARYNVIDDMPNSRAA